MPQESPAEASRRLALDFIDACFRCDVDAVLSRLAPDATWWVLGDREHLKVSGTRDRLAIERFLRNVARMFPQGMGYAIEGVTAEPGRVAIEATSHARQADGRDYANRYHFAVTLQDGKVLAMREYLDTFYVWQVQQGSDRPAG
ncbi:MAG: nuclear transport factor 2 family protein [Pseudomonadota bacterium]